LYCRKAKAHREVLEVGNAGIIAETGEVRGNAGETAGMGREGEASRGSGGEEVEGRKWRRGSVGG